MSSGLAGVQPLECPIAESATGRITVVFGQEVSPGPALFLRPEFPTQVSNVGSFVAGGGRIESRIEGHR
jgi:hypothetical protein